MKKFKDWQKMPDEDPPPDDDDAPQPDHPLGEDD